jgi:hypothetical protein
METKSRRKRIQEETSETEVKTEEATPEVEVKLEENLSKVEEKGEASGIETIEVSTLTEGDDTFLSYGYSNVKVTKSGKVINVKLKIKSSGVTELIEEFKKKEPKPPTEEVRVMKDSDLGKQLKLTENRPVRMPNLADPKYVEALNEYESNLGIAILQKGLDVTMYSKEGKEITDSDKKIAILKSMGMSGPQFTQVIQDIRNMTEWTEEEMQSFFGQN